MKPIVLTLFCLFLFSCHANKSNTGSRQDSLLSESKPKPKTLDEVKMTLLDSRLEKADIFLGKPDKKGILENATFYYEVYFDRVLDDGRIKHLLLISSGNAEFYNYHMQILDIQALNDGETVTEVDRSVLGNSVYHLTVSKNGLRSDCSDFNCGNGDVSWDKIKQGAAGDLNVH